MSKKVIISIIILMSAALIGLSVIQFLWIRKSLALKEKTFDDRIFITLNMAKEKLLENLQEDITILGLEKKISTQDERRREQLEYELKKNKMLSDTNLLENIEISHIEELDNFISKELKINQGIDLTYEYGIYSNRTKSFLIRDGHFVVEFGNSKSSSTIKTQDGLESTPYSLPLFEDVSSNEPGYLKLYFPKRTRYLWQNLIPIVLSSILFTALVLFCFSYTVYIVFKQKKISEIKNDFINNMTHEFKTPIATISLASDSIGNASIIGNPEKIKRFLSIIKAENKRMLNQVEKVLQMAQIDKKEITIKPAKIDINELVENVAENSALKVQSRGGSLEINLLAKYTQIQADQTHLSNIVANLIDNAEKYTKETPHIIVETQDDKDGIKIIVKDNGIGMSKDSQKHIFEKFYRVHTGNLHDVKGFGLGLSYVKAITEAHGGRVFVKSELGKGSTFTVFIPFKPKFS
ncbi:MAG TPA: HAMP domain-containing sensor histidine kinase [Saprospiraceae bacterium]|nr:HAMP domain-containing sensor histidine kinase [Saprospiraceae bacterium]